jgi:zinc transport system substrate-binding protein
MENSNIKYAEKIARSVGAKTAMLHSCHNLSREEFKNGETYLSIMRRNLEVLKEAME